MSDPLMEYQVLNGDAGDPFWIAVVADLTAQPIWDTFVRAGGAR